MLEDDYDAEYRYDRAPVGAVQGLAPDRVTYAGSVSKTLAPGLRLGWLVVPERLAAGVVDAKAADDLGTPVVEQLALADFLERGELDRHLRRTRAVYRARRDALVAALAAAPARMPARGRRRRAAPGGLAAGRRRRAARARARALARARPVRARPSTAWSPGPPALLLGYGRLASARHRRGRRGVGGGRTLRGMSYEHLIWERDGGVARITLNRPETPQRLERPRFGRELKQAIEVDAADPSVRAVLVTGAGRGFSSGADLKAGFDVADDGMPDVAKELNELYHPIMAGVRRLEKPVVAAVNGPAVGIGASLAFACDLVLAAESAYFGLAFVNIGLMPDGGSTLFVPTAVGKARAFQMALLGERDRRRSARSTGGS